MISQCAGCSRFIQGTSKDPIITGKLLGWKNYHDACAKHEWARLARSGKSSRFQRDKSHTTNEIVSLNPAERREEVEMPKPAKKTQFHVQCVLMTNGKEESRWYNIVDTMDEAEKYCVKQMGLTEFDQAWLAVCDVCNGTKKHADANGNEDASVCEACKVEGKPVCNASPLKYVNCTVSMMMTNGKSTVIEERVHPMALALEDMLDPACPAGSGDTFV